MKIGQCFYAPLIDENAGLLNDPVILKRGTDWFWFSIADSDILLWAKGLALGMNLDVAINEPDVSPLAVQGPMAEDLVANVFGEQTRSIRYFHFMVLPFAGRSLVVARSGYSKQGGFEIYLDDSSLGGALWDTLWAAGEPFQVTPGYPNLIERVESGLLSYGNEMTHRNNPLEINLDRFCRVDGMIDYVGRTALQAIARSGPIQRIRGVMFDGPPCPPCGQPWPLIFEEKKVGQITTAIWSPKFQKNIALGMVEESTWEIGQKLVIQTQDGELFSGIISALPITPSKQKFTQSKI
jgi:dimethylsulfoniopropionate demethylase